MAETEYPAGEPADDADAAQRRAAEYRRDTAGEGVTRDVERESSGADLGQQIRADVEHLHKGDVGRGGTNEAIFQGSKETELDE